MMVSFRPLYPDAVDFLSDRTRIDFRHTDFRDPEQWLCCTVRDDEGSVEVVTVFEFKEWFNAHMTVASANPRAITRRLVHALMFTVFQRATRITALIPTDNVAALKQVAQLGFRQEGFMRNAVEGSTDAHLFGLVAEDCPYLASSRSFRTKVPPLTHEAPHGLVS